jgi:hypothetical protein
MKYNATQLLSKYDKAKSNKNIWDNKYDEIFDLTMPDRNNFYNNNNPRYNPAQGEDKRPTLYTSTGEQSADRFVNRIQSLLTPIGANWIGLEAAAESEDADAINEQLDKISLIANTFKAGSNFDANIAEFYYDLVAGTACLLVIEGDEGNPLNFKPIPINEIVIEEGVDGEVANVYRCFSMRKEIVKYQWVELNNMELADNPHDKEKTMELVECTYKDYETGIYHYKVIDKKEKKYLVEREYKTNPFIVLRWSKCAGEVYGRGLGWKVKNDLKTLNLAVEYSLRALAFSIPTLLAQQDASVDYDDFLLEPGAINPVPSTANNNPSVVPLQMPLNADIQQYNIDTLKMDIKKNMLDNTLPPDAAAPRTATEIAQRAQELNVDITSVFGRLISDFLRPCVKRIIDILQKFGYISQEFDVDQIDGLGFKIKINTPLAKQQTQGEVMGILNAVSMMMQFDPTGQTIQQGVKMAELLSYTLDQMGVPNRFINSPEEMQAVAKQMAESMRAQQEQAMQDEVAMEGAKERMKNE